MKLIFSILLMLVACTLQASKYYLAPDGRDNTGAGTYASPWFSPSKAWTVVNAGDTVYMRGGTYSYYHQSSIYLSGKYGTAGSLIKLWNYPGEIPVITKASGYPENYGMFLSGNYIHFKGLKISGFAQKDSVGYRNVSYALWAISCNNCIFENLNVCYNGAGVFIQGSMSASGGPCDGNHVLNCDFHHNKDPYSPYPNTYGNASGISINRITTGTNYVSYCRMYLNTDEGIDTWLSDGTTVLKGNWAWQNGYLPGDHEGDPDPATATSGNGDGFKLGPGISIKTATTRYLSYNVSAFNKEFGYNDNINPGANGCAMDFVNNLAYGNVGQGFNLNTDNYAHRLVNSLAHANNSGGSQALIESYATVTTCSFLKGSGQSDSRFPVSASSFKSIAISQLSAPRQSDNSLPYVDCFRLASTATALINAGTAVNDYYGPISYLGSAPDLGAFEYLPLKETGSYTTHKGKIWFHRGKKVK